MRERGLKVPGLWMYIHVSNTLAWRLILSYLILLMRFLTRYPGKFQGRKGGWLNFSNIEKWDLRACALRYHFRMRVRTYREVN